VRRPDENTEGIWWALVDGEIRKEILRHLWEYFVYMEFMRERVTDANTYLVLDGRMRDVERLLELLEEMEPVVEEDDEEEDDAW
jgi:hypothetical protein